MVAQPSTERISLVRPEPSWATAQAITAVVQDLAASCRCGRCSSESCCTVRECSACDAGSICSVDEAAGIYRKEADIGVALPVGAGLPADRGDDRRRRGARGR